MSVRTKPSLSRAAKALDKVLSESGEIASAIRAKVHRVSLSRYRNGWERPNHDTARLLEELSGGRVRHKEWAIPSSAHSFGAGA
jgi:hypothetical protein